MKNRNALLDYVNEKKCKIAVEVGSYAGEFALEIMKRTKIERLYCVDSFDYRNVSEKNRDNGAYERFYERLNGYIDEGRLYPYKRTSPQAAEGFPMNSFDFIYLDAGHAYIDVKKDLIAWYPRLKLGGIIAGHDYKNLGHKKQVKKAVDEYFELGELVVNSTDKCRGEVPSFWVQT